MNAQKKTFSPYFIPSIADIIFLSVFLIFAFCKGGGLLGDTDTGWHIRVGDYILATHSIPRQDIFSFITPTIPWTAHEWFAEIIMSVTHSSFGLTGIVIFYAFMIAMVYYLLFRMLRNYNKNILLAILIAIFVIASSTMHWLARPHIFTHLLLMITYMILDGYQTGRSNRLYWLPLLMIVWVNVHGGFVVCLLLLGIYFLGNIFEAFFAEINEKEACLGKVKEIGIVGLFCLIACLANPRGYHILLFPFNVVSNTYLMDHIQEFSPPNFHQPMFIKYLLFILIALLAYSKKRLSVIELMLVIVFLNMALFSIRHVPLLAIIIAPIIVSQSTIVLSASKGRFAELLHKKGAEMAAIDASACGVTWIFIGLAVVITAVSAGKIHFDFDPKNKPVAAVEFLKREPIQGNMFNNDQFGSYIIYTAQQDYKVFFDGRSDMYGVDRINEYNKIRNFEPGWEKILGKYHITWIIFSAESELSRFLQQDGEWYLIYADKIANIFVRNITAYHYLIDKYKDVKPVPYEENDKSGS
jgi:hypothetical protein